MDDIKAAEFNEIAEMVFAPLYPVIAEQVTELTGIKKGICMDLGCGPGHLAMALTSLCDFSTFALDSSLPVLRHACRNIAKRNLAHRISPVNGDVKRLPFMTDSADIIVSRGSVFFWQNRPEAFREVIRVLFPGGYAVIGGGFGTAEIKKEIFRKMDEWDEEFSKRVNQRLGTETESTFIAELDASVPGMYKIVKDEANFWIVIHKK